jgi:hypothetical protein
MAITGIDTIDGKQIIAAGAVSAKSAEMAYNDENGNPITSYLTAVPEGYATTGDLTAYQTTAGMTAYQSAGDYLSANALDDVSGDWNRISALSGYSANGWSVKTTAAAVVASPISFTASGIPKITGYLTVSSAPRKWCTIMDGGIYLYNTARGNSAQFIRPDTILKWNNYASGKLNATATANFYTTANESGFISEVPAGTMNESAFGYDSDNKISSYNGSAFAGGGGEFPQSATEAIETVTANSADWNGTTETVSSNSGTWGGSALPISAGPGIKFEMVNDTLVASVTSTSTSGYVWQSASLFHTDSPVTQTTYTLSDDCSNYDKLEVDFYDINNWRTVMDCPIPPNLAASGTRGGYFSVVPASTATGAKIWFKAFNWTAAGNTWTCYCSELAGQGGSTTQTINANQPDNPPKVLQIIGWKRVGGN